MARIQAVDCVLGYHMNPMTCGVAKFNTVLARKLGVPFLNLFSAEVDQYRNPLLSIKVSEFSAQDVARCTTWIEGAEKSGRLHLFLHEYLEGPVERLLVERAEIVYCGNEALAERLAQAGARAVPLWCPGTNMRPEVFEPTELSVFSFGMAHKVRAEKYLRLRSLLEKTGRSYVLYLSTALHDGTSFDDSFSEAFEELKVIFDGKIYFLGYLSDQAVYNYLVQTTYFAAFFDEGVRGNNTSVNTALQAGTVVVTNLDRHSPRQMMHGVNVIDINQCQVLPTDAAEREALAHEARKLGWGDLGWDALVKRFGANLKVGSR